MTAGIDDVGRTLILAILTAKIATLSPQRDVLKGKRVIVVDDSIVRGTTSRKIIRMLRDAGACASGPPSPS